MRNRQEPKHLTPKQISRLRGQRKRKPVKVDLLWEPEIPEEIMTMLWWSLAMLFIGLLLVASQPSEKQYLFGQTPPPSPTPSKRIAPTSNVQVQP